MTISDAILAVAMFVVAVLYATVGHAGASGYLAAMSLAGLPPEVMKPSALTLNIFVALVATWKFARAGAFSARLFWPLALASTPCAYLGGYLTLPPHLYKPLVGLVLLYAAFRSFRSAAAPDPELRPALPLSALASMGVGLGFLSGLTGVGGGIFLSPLLLALRVAEPRVISGVAAAFILVNSAAGLLGVLTAAETPPLPPALPAWLLAALLGGTLGAELGSRRLANPAIKRLLAAVLLLAALKMIFADVDYGKLFGALKSPFVR